MEALPNSPPTSLNAQIAQSSSSPVPPESLSQATIETTLPPEEQHSLWLRKWLIIFVSVGVLVILSLFGWWLYQTLQLDQHIPIQEIDTSSAITGFPDITDTWRLHTSQNCRYQISYPPDWHIYTEAEQEDLSAILISSSQIQNKTIAPTDVRLQIGCSSIDTALATKTVIDDLNTRYLGKGFVLSAVQQTTVAGKPAYIQTVSSQTGTLKEYYIFPTSGRVIIVNIDPSNSLQLNTADSILNRIIFY